MGVSHAAATPQPFPAAPLPSFAASSTKQHLKPCWMWMDLRWFWRPRGWIRWSGLDVEGADGGGAGEAMRQAQSMVLALDNDNARLGGPCGAAASRLLATGQAHHTSHDSDCRGRHRAARHGQHSTVAFTAAAVGLKGFCIVLFVYGTEHAYHGLHTKTWPCHHGELQPPAAAAATKGRQRRMILPWPRVLRQN
ncbi:uncharacterized protein [Miscanthus floridulus]|uniref:uncharacterized protein n=1 Tax=Miscanthus floridulus TaxID=154761 RepID=UPI0034580F30